MSDRHGFPGWLAASVAVAAAMTATMPGEAAARGGVLCTVDGIVVRADFERARASACRLDDSGALVIDILPEAPGVNWSPWYAFAIEADAARTVPVILNYPGYRHRYVPHTSSNGGAWRRFDPAAVTAEGQTGSFALDLPAGRTVVAAQPFHTMVSALAPWQARVDAGQLRQARIGRSRGGRPIHSYTHQSDTAEAVLVILGRVHPPEETGAWAMDGFAARLFAEDSLAVQFRRRVTVVAAPLINPDGFVDGNWRTNRAGTDLNRDYGPFAQPETRAVRSMIEQAGRLGPMAAVFDFHSTRRDLIYAQPADAPLSQQALMEAWLTAWQAGLAVVGDGPIEIRRTHIPDEGSSKSWAREALGLSAITYEVGDNTPFEVSFLRGWIAAEAVMTVMMANPTSAAGLPPTSATEDPPLR